VLAVAIGRFHDEDVGGGWGRRVADQGLVPQAQVAGKEQALAVGVDFEHRRSEDMPGLAPGDGKTAARSGQLQRTVELHRAELPDRTPRILRHVQRVVPMRRTPPLALVTLTLELGVFDL